MIDDVIDDSSTNNDDTCRQLIKVRVHWYHVTRWDICWIYVTLTSELRAHVS